MQVELDTLYDAVQGDNLELLIDFHMNMLNVVLQQGADTFLHTAAINGADKIISYLLDNGLNINALNAEKKTPLMLAYENNHLGVATQLLSSGADLTIYYPSGRTQIQQALYDGKLDFVNLYRTFGVDLLQKSTNNKSVIHYILKTIGLTFEQQEQLLEELYLSPESQLSITEEDLTSIIDKKGYRMLHQIAFNGHLKLFNHLFEKFPNLDINILNNQGSSPLIIATYYGHTELIKQFLKVPSIDVSIKNNSGLYGIESTLTFAYPELLKILLPLQKNFLTSSASSSLMVSIFITWDNMFREKIGSTLSTKKSAATVKNPADIDHSAVVAEFDMLVIHNFQLSQAQTEVMTILATIFPEPIKNVPYKCCTLLHHAFDAKAYVLADRIIDTELSNKNYTSLKSICAGKKIIVTEKEKCAGCNMVHPDAKEVQKEIQVESHESIFSLACNSDSIVQIDKLLSNGFSTQIDQDQPPNCSLEVLKFLIDKKILNYSDDPLTYPRINSAGKPVWKDICLLKNVIKNTVELTTNLPVEEISSENFIILENGIAWDIKNLVYYLIKTSSNEYSERDQEAIYMHSAKNNMYQIKDKDQKTYGQLYQDFQNFKINKALFDKVDAMASIAWGKGADFEHQLKEIFTPEELIIWNETKPKKIEESPVRQLLPEELISVNDQEYEAEPTTLPFEMIKKIEDLKRAKLTMFFLYFESLSANQKALFESLYDDSENFPFHQNLLNVIQGNGSILKLAKILYDIYLNYLKIELSIKTFLQSYHSSSTKEDKDDKEDKEDKEDKDDKDDKEDKEDKDDKKPTKSGKSIRKVKEESEDEYVEGSMELLD